MALPTWNVALIVDAALDAGMFRRLLNKDRRAAYVLDDISGLDPIATLRERPVDILIVSMSGGDERSAAAIRRLTAARPELPVLVVHGGEEGFGNTCVREGAAEALHRRHLNATVLKLCIAAVVGRQRAREGRLAERRASAFELVAHHLVNGWLAATQGWDPLLRKRTPARFEEAVDAYGQVLIEWLRNKREETRQSRAPLRHIAAQVERLRGRPADVVDIHSHAVARLVKGMDEAKARGTAMVAHGLALEIIGRLEAVKESAPWLRAPASRRRSSGVSMTGGVRRTSGLGVAGSPPRTSGLMSETSGGGSVARGSRVSTRAGETSDRGEDRRTLSYEKKRRGSDLDVVEVTGRREEK